MIKVVPLDFIGQGALLEPADRKLHDLAVEYCSRELKGGTVDFSKFSKIWVGLKDGAVLGVLAYVLKPDVPLCRATDADVLRALAQRMNDFCADNGAIGKEVFIYIGNEPRESRCPEWRNVLREMGATSARRVSIEVK
jgi:hypothetical protein